MLEGMLCYLLACIAYVYYAHARDLDLMNSYESFQTNQGRFELDALYLFPIPHSSSVEVSLPAIHPEQRTQS